MCFMRKILFIIYMLTCLLPGIVSAQSKVVNGTVIDETGQPLYGATVLIKGTKKATITDVTGIFSITADAKAILLVSFTGFTTREIAINGQSTLRIQLKENNKELDEVIIVAYGKQKKPTVTGSIATLSGKDLRQSPVANLTNALAGRLPGLFSQQNSGQPGKDMSNIQIRGVSTYTGSSAPLFIVDGVQQDDIGQIDMNEIDNISILKDASATAVYGVRGANGVIIITTRRGKTGEAKVSVNTQTGINVTNRLPKFLNAYDALTLLKESYANDKQVFPYTDAEMEHYRTGDMPLAYPNTDWYKELLRKTTIQSQVNVNVSGGTDRVKYFVSGGYLYQNGIFKSMPQAETNNDYYFKRYNFRSNLDINVNKNLDLTLNLSSTLQNINQPHPAESGRSVFNQLMRLGFEAYNYPIYNPDGSYGASSVTNNHPNMAAQLTLAGYDRTYQTDVNTTLAAVQKLGFIAKGLTARMQLAFNNVQTSYRSLYRSGYPTYRYDPRRDPALDPTLDPKSNPYTLFNSGAPVLRPFQVATEDPNNGNLKKPRSITDLQGSLNYENQFGKHNITAFAMYTQNSTLRGADKDLKYIGYVGRLTYNYNQRYLFEVSAGYNGSNMFNDQNHFGLFPSVSAGWVLSEESFVKNNLKFINLLKLRGSYGLTGNDKIGVDLTSFPYLSTYITPPAGTFGNSYTFGESNTNYSGLVEGTLGNPDISWEKERKTNLALDASFLDSKIKLTFEYFDNYRYDIITQRATVGQIVGVSFPRINMGKVRNKGFDFELGHNNRIGKIGYFINANLSYAKNKIIERDEPTLRFPWLQATGRSVGQQFGWQAIGFFKDAADLANSPKPANSKAEVGDLKYQDLNGDGIINDDDKGAIGHPQIPNTTYGISGGMNYEGFDFSFLLQGAMNGSVRLSDELIYDNLGRFQESHLGRWTPETAETATYPKLHVTNTANNRNFSSFWLRPADYMRLKNVEIGYKLTPGFIKRIGMESVRIHANGSNLITWDKLGIVDPESPGGRGENYPQQKVYSFGMNFNF
jgi:TonB-linked SusC/RagA family outer membrane protein